MHRACGRRVVLPTVLLGVLAAGFLGLTSTGVGAAAPDPATARLEGAWNLTITVASYTGGGAPSSFEQPVGHSGIVPVTFTSTCTAPGNCIVAIAGAQAQVGYDQATQFQIPLDNPLVETGGTLSDKFNFNGYGGPGIQCGSPPLPALRLNLTVTEAVADAQGARAVTVTGEEVVLQQWCDASGLKYLASPRYKHLGIVGHPVGYVAPRAAVIAAPAAVPPSLANPQPSTLATSLISPGEAFSSVPQVVANVVITLAIVLFITFPAQLFNKTFEENYDEIREIVRRRLSRLRVGITRIRSIGFAPVRFRSVALLIVVMLTGAVLGGLLDPKFGFNASSVPTLAATLLAICWGMARSTAVGAAYRTAAHQPRTVKPKALPAGLAIAATCVLISRLTDFQPGYLYGVVCGIAFTRPLRQPSEGHVVALDTLAVLVVAGAAWVAWVPINAAAGNVGAGFGLVLTDDFLGSIFNGGLVGSVIALMPLSFLPGAKLAAWNRWVWASTFAIAVFGVIDVVLRPEYASTHGKHASVATAIALFVIFGGGSLAFRYYFHRRHLRAAAGLASAAD